MAIDDSKQVSLFGDKLDDPKKNCKTCGQAKPYAEFRYLIKRKYGTKYRRNDCNACVDKRRIEWEKINHERRSFLGRKRNLKSFGLTLQKFEEMEESQDGVCSICKNPEKALRNGKTKRLAIDHCHTTGIVRSLLCQDCNTMIGLSGDSSKRLRLAADYLERHRAQANIKKVQP